MRYGAMNSPLLPLDDEIKIIGELGFDYLELTMDPPYADYLSLQNKCEHCSGLLEKYDLGLVCHLPTFVSIADLSLGLREASIRETVEALTVARRLGCEKAVLHPWIVAGLGTKMPKRAEKYGSEALEVILEDAAEKGVEVCLENLFPRARSLDLPEHFLPWFSKFPDLQLTLDTGHANLVGGMKTLCSFISLYGDRIGHLHASDNRGQSDDHLPIGAGNIDFAEVVKALKSVGYNGTLTFEIFTDDREYLSLSRTKFQKLFAAL